MPGVYDNRPDAFLGLNHFRAVLRLGENLKNIKQQQYESKKIFSHIFASHVRIVAHAV